MYTQAKFTQHSLRILGTLLIILPLVYHWYISKPDRFITMIQGPFPFSHLGSGLYGFTLDALGYILGATLVVFSIHIADTWQPSTRRLFGIGKKILMILSVGIILLAARLLVRP